MKADGYFINFDKNLFNNSIKNFIEKFLARRVKYEMHRP